MQFGRLSWWAWLLIVLGVVGIVLGVTLVASRELSNREIDDVHPDIPCRESALNDSTWLWVIPLYGDQPLTSNPDWVERIKKSGKKLGMHGVRHTYAEFATDVSKEYIQKGMDEFEKAFGYRPTDFKPPKLQITAHNMQLLKELGLKVHNRWQQTIHKVYHCEDHGRTDRSRLRADESQWPCEQKCYFVHSAVTVDPGHKPMVDNGVQRVIYVDIGKALPRPMVLGEDGQYTLLNPPLVPDPDALQALAARTAAYRAHPRDVTEMSAQEIEAELNTLQDHVNMTQDLPRDHPMVPHVSVHERIYVLGRSDLARV